MLRFEYGSMSSEDLKKVMRRGSASMDKAVTIARPIVEGVRREGDRALLRFARKFDGFRGTAIRVPLEDAKDAVSRLPPGVWSSLRLSKKRIEGYHRRQRLGGFEFEDSCGSFGQMVVPVDRVGIYVPGGGASYASSVLMSAIPAKIAGVDDIVVCTPARDGKIADPILAASHLVGAREILSIGGAHAIAAMAYGTETVRAVSKIVGPGGEIVSAAKSLVRIDCEIDSIAGPSEILIIADTTAKPTPVAHEMIAQLEHDPSAVAVLVSSSDRMLDKVSEALAEMINQADRREVVRGSSAEGAVLVKVRNLREAIEFSNRYAPEHLLIDTRDPRRLLPEVRNAGSVFLGSWSSVAFGDYCSGTNHVLPTMGTARSKSALSVYDFLKIVPYQELTLSGARQLAPVVRRLAKAEGLPNHAVAASSRAGGAR